MGLGTVSQPHTLLAQAVHFALDHEIAWSREITDTWGVGYPLSPGQPAFSMTGHEGLTTRPGPGQLVAR